MRKIFASISVLALSVAAFAQDGWSPAGDNIRTPWADEVNPAAPLPEYPRPQMVRADWQNLNGLWTYAITPVSASAFEAEGEILVPFAIESSLSGVGKSVGRDNALWYEREFTVPSKWKGRDIILHFGAVDWLSELWINGQKVGEHKGGFTPFEYNITPYLKKSGRQTLTMKVFDATDNSYQPRGKQICVPEGIWYTPVTGIWQTVWMEPVAAAHITDYYVVSDIDNAKMSFEVASEGVTSADVVKVQLVEGAVGYSAETPGSTVLAEAVVKDGKAEIAVPDMKTWSPDEPYLYGIKISIVRGKKVMDCVDGYTAMRKVSMCRSQKTRYSYDYKRIGLNNAPLFQYGPLDQGWWPDGLYTAPTDEALKFDIVKTKDWGFNMIRKHIKVEPARWYYWCDVLGMLVWQDMPSIADHGRRAYRDAEIEKNVRNRWAGDSFVGGTDCVIPEEWKQNYYREWTDIIQSLKKFQCIVVWVPFNEAWGQFDTPVAVELTRKLDPTRLINESSGGNFSFCGDIIDVHHYPFPAMNAFEARFINVLGEYGGIGLPVEGHLWQKDRNWGYVKYSNGKEVLDEYEKFAEMLKVFTRTGCSAAVYTQTTDVEGEVNGIMTYDRKVIKVDEERLARINRAVIKSMDEPLVK
ncbi:MAG: beta-galactosidase [Bacteroidales bacterium]|nr:beta-galactosidase [Bacteroidales bacterium]